MALRFTVVELLLYDLFEWQLGYLSAEDEVYLEQHRFSEVVETPSLRHKPRGNGGEDVVMTVWLAERSVRV